MNTAVRPIEPIANGVSERRPRILQVVLSLGPGGTEHLVIELCRRLRPQFDVAVCCLDDAGAWASKLLDRRIEVIALGRRTGFRPDIGGRIAGLATEWGADVLHCHHYSPFVYGRIAALLNRRVKLLYTEHGRLSDAPPPWKRRLINPILARFDGPIVAVSHDLRDYMISARFPAKRVNVIHNGIAAGSAPSPIQRGIARRQLGIGDDTFAIATVARLDPVKDLHTMLDAFALVRRDISNARLFLVGDGPERDWLTARAARPDLAGSVTFAGYRSDVQTFLTAADLYVNSSISEGISLTILEAMAAALPVVATEVGGTPEIVDGATGVLVPSRDPARLASAIIGLGIDHRRRERLAAAARRRVEAQFTIERMIDQYARTYRRLLD